MILMMLNKKVKKFFIHIFVCNIATFNNRNMNEKDLFIIDNIFIEV